MILFLYFTFLWRVRQFYSVNSLFLFHLPLENLRRHSVDSLSSILFLRIHQRYSVDSCRQRDIFSLSISCIRIILFFFLLILLKNRLKILILQISLLHLLHLRSIQNLKRTRLSRRIENLKEILFEFPNYEISSPSF